jgi:hypothetical protein
MHEYTNFKNLKGNRPSPWLCYCGIAWAELRQKDPIRRCYYFSVQLEFPQSNFTQLTGDPSFKLACFNVEAKYDAR